MVGNSGRWWERIVFAGMKSGKPGPASQPKPRNAFRQALDRYLSGVRNEDPLYISNRTWKDRLATGFRLWGPLAVLIIAATWFGISRVVPKPPPKYDLTAAEVLSKLKLPDLSDVKPEPRRALEVAEVGVRRGHSLELAGMVRNVSSEPIESAEVDIDIAESSGTRLSTQTVKFQALAPSAEARFQVPLSDSRAQIAIVRSIRTK